MSARCDSLLAMARASQEAGNKAEATGYLQQAQQELAATERGLDEQRAVFAACGVADGLMAYEQMWLECLADKESVRKALDTLLAS
jgi:ABC-type sulfate transport system substrate-binding protein